MIVYLPPLWYNTESFQEKNSVIIILGGLFLIGYWSYTVILTYLGLVSAFTGIVFSVLFATGEIISSVIFPLGCLLICGFCDMFDGRVARTKKNRSEDEKNFGMQIDSLCDLVCFTVLPATLGFCLRIYQERASTHMVVQLTTVIISIPRGPGFGSLKFKTKRTAMMIREI